MLTIVTGAPGAGKTCAMVSLMMSELAGRPLYVDGVDGLTLDHTPVDLNEWHVTVPKGVGAVVCGDEGQRRWRPRGPGQRVPPAIEAMETHRHDGLDFFVTTQGPSLLDKNIRELCGRHVHIRDLGVLGRYWYEWPECQDNPKTTWKTAPIKRKYKLDRKAFSKYKSASLHVKPVRSFPWMVVLLVAAALVVVGLGWRTYKVISARMSPPAVHASAVDGQAGVTSPGAALNAPTAVKSVVHPSDFVPRWSAHPESAPAYDDLRRVVVMPRVVGGWCQGERCQCVNQQGSDAGLTWADCRAWLRSPPFNPYALPAPVPAAPVGVQSSQPSTS